MRQTITLQQLLNDGIDLFAFKYSLYDNSLKPELEQRILDEYLYDYIGIVPPARFVQRFVTKFKAELPRYNEYLRIEQEKYNFLLTDYNETIETGSDESINKREYGSNTTSQGNSGQRVSVRDDGTIDNTSMMDGNTTGNTSGHTVEQNTTNSTEKTTSKDTGTEQQTTTGSEVTTGRSTDTSTDTTTGHSERDTNEHQSKSNTTATRFYDTPGSSTATPVGNDQLTQYTQVTDSGTVDKTGTEIIDSRENKTHEGSGTTNGSKDTEGSLSKNTEDNGTIDKTGEVVYNGTSDSTGTSEGTSHTDEAGNTISHSDTFSATDSDDIRNTNVDIAEVYKKATAERARRTTKGRNNRSPSELKELERAAVHNVLNDFVLEFRPLFLGVVV